ncbi:MAG: ribosome maturation factor RimM [Actinomycetales bacterium]|nr:ribosome maturation factor RimM [Actinomycetales bacterium]
MELVVARIGRAHGLRGELVLDVRTDAPERRFAVGAVLRTSPASAGPLKVVAVREHSGQLLVRFAQAPDRTAAEALRGVELVVEADASDEDDAWYPHEIAGLEARRADGTVLGEIEGVEHLPAQDALVLREVGGERTLVPFIEAFVPQVDVRGGFVVLAPPGGLLASDVEHLDVAAPEGD